jgi:hypothetical protein
MLGRNHVIAGMSLYLAVDWFLWSGGRHRRWSTA